MSVKILGFRALLLTSIVNSYLFGATSGIAFRDYNADGIKQAGEPGVGNIIVKAYKKSANGETKVAEVITDINGAYNLDISAPARLEFEIPQNKCNLKNGQDFPSAGGANYGTSIQFLKADGEKHNFAISYPYDFSTQDNPETFTTIMASGDPLGGGSTGEVAGVVKFHFKDEGHAANSGRGATDGPAWIELAKLKQVGTTRALAYSRQARKLFVAAYVKRHAGLGPLGSGGIYIIDPDPSKNTDESVKFIDLDSIGIPTSDKNGAYNDAKNGSNKVVFSPVIGTNSQRGLNADKTQPSKDSAAYGQVGRLGIGDIDISEDGQYLYIVNLYDRKLYKIDLTNPKNPIKPTQDKVSSYDIPNSCNYSAKAGEYRPFGLKVLRNQAYIGITCSGQDATGNIVADSTADMKGSVYKLDLNSGIWSDTPEIEWTFDYRDSDGSEKPWHTWTNSFQSAWEYGIPMIGDIEFDNAGDMLISIIDLHGDLLGYKNYDLDGSGSNSTASTGDLIKTTINSNADNCSYSMDLSKEFYDDNYKHTESSGGMLAGHHTSDTDSVLSSFMDPVDIWSNGVHLYDNKTGKRITKGYEIVNNANQNTNDLTVMGKANAIGDLEVLETTPPIEVGNRVWLDSNRDGIQNPDENGIADVNLELYEGKSCSGDPIAKTKTDSNGNYIFNYANVNPASNTPGLQANSDYSICIAKSDFDNGIGVDGSSIANLALTTSDATATASDNSDKVDSDAIDNAGKAYITFTTKGAGENDHSYDIGLVKLPACLGDKVWIDSNANGIQDGNESGLDGINIKLYDEKGNAVVDYDGNSVASVTTDTNGNYKFCNLVPDKSYHIKVTVPNEYVVSPKDKGDDTKDSDIDENSGESKNITLKSNEKNYTLDAGLYKKGCLGNFIWEDKNANGIQDVGENGVKGAKVEMFDENNKKVDEITTGANGEYKVCGKPGVKYYIQVTPPADYKVSPKNSGADIEKDSNIDPVTKKSDPVAVKMGKDNFTIDTGLFKPACLGDYVWKDENANGIQDANEKQLSGVEVTLLDKDAKEIKTIKTDANGKYKFCGLTPGSYSVKFKANPDANGVPYLSTKRDSGDDSKDSDIEEFKENEATSNIVVLASGDNNLTLDAGFTQEICIGDKVWEDKNANGIQDAGEKAIKGVKLTLTDKAGNEVKNIKGDLVTPISTDSNGIYKFCHLNPTNEYIVKVKKPDGYLTTIKDSGADDSKDSDVDENGDILTNLSNKDTMSYDAGLFKPACIGDKVWEDKNANGIQDAGENPIEGAEITILDENGKEVKIDAYGKDYNSTLVTSKDGEYNFCKLVPGKYTLSIKPPRGYYVTTKDVTSKDTDANDVDSDSDFDTKTNMTVAVTLESGEKDNRWDAGLFKPACLGDYIWEDKNANGKQDSNEEGAEGVVVKLLDKDGNSVKDVNGSDIKDIVIDKSGAYKFCQLRPGSYHIEATIPSDSNYTVTFPNKGDDSKNSDLEPVYSKDKATTKDVTLISGENNLKTDGGLYKPACLGSAVWLDKNGNGIQDKGEPGIGNVTVTLLNENGDSTITDASGKPISEIVTGDDGKYMFCNLVPNSYRVKFEAKAENGVPYISTGSGQGSEENDSDIPEYIKNGGVTKSVKIESGQVYQAVKAGFVQEVCLGDFVWYDENLNGIKDKSESGVVGTKITLYGADKKPVEDTYGNIVTATKTDKNGKYKFCHLKPAKDYYIKVDAPESYIITKEGKDNKANKDGWIFVKNAVKDDYTLDSGIICECDEYKLNQDGKSDSASAFNFGGLIALFIFMINAARREKRA